ncbi:MAG: iron-only hydrogenase system regulator [Duodenibacillus sp.]|nr:iron-only hydrogenase system regulator [Duodenibacillus sp.]
MENRVAIIGVIVEEQASVAPLNDIVHQFSQHIIGRVGVPCRGRAVSVISLILDAPQDQICALAGKLGRLPGVSARTLFSK